MNKLMALTFFGPVVLCVFFFVTMWIKIGLKNISSSEKIYFYRVFFAIPVNFVLMLIFLNSPPPSGQFGKLFAMVIFLLGIAAFIGGRLEFFFHSSNGNPIFKKYLILVHRLGGCWLIMCALGVLLCGWIM
jgi:hypothetical protein